MNGISPEDVKTFLEAFKVLNAAHPLIGVAVAILGLITAVLTLINNFRTKRNTKAHEETAAMLAAHRAEMTQLKSEAIKEVRAITQDLKASVDEARAQFSDEARQFKLGVARSNDLMGQRLSMIPSIQKAIEELGKQNVNNAFRTAQTEAKVEEIITMIKRAKEGKR